ncbi:HtaA domain-containing protein [Leifsonia sp. Leaf264]|uniref:HtaA domain-containing protein n=1 Tax=Leifsonia sp. Leaf264 TaxID=1736314 RepID=UPI0006FD35B0|nr:HtaA domain-containing protein [Leifsonia sp. Leaf264]KQO97454.1 hypothetical protein ASF30_13515 [Leifsonia sp. Leaf264]
MTTATATESALRWAVRDSLIRYVTVIAKGTHTVSGGAVEGDDGVFSFPLLRAVREGADWRMSFSGSVHFLAHNGLLDVLVTDPEIVIGPDGGVLATHIVGDPDELLAVVALEPAAHSETEAGLVWPEIGTQLAASAVDLFGTVYAAGTPMAPIGIRLTLDS